MLRTRKARSISLVRGSMEIEYGLILPALLLFTLGIMDGGRLLWTYTTLYRAVEAAARCGAINVITCGTAAEIKNYAAAQAWGLTISASAFTTGTCLPNGVQVHGTYTFNFVIPMLYSFGGGAITLTATACYPH